MATINGVGTPVPQISTALSWGGAACMAYLDEAGHGIVDDDVDPSCFHVCYNLIEFYIGLMIISENKITNDCILFL